MVIEDDWVTGATAAAALTVLRVLLLFNAGVRAWFSSTSDHHINEGHFLLVQDSFSSPDARRHPGIPTPAVFLQFEISFSL